jgi:hypothetical protein
MTSVILNLGAALTYSLYKDWNRTIYWLAAATLTICVTLR